MVARVGLKDEIRDDEIFPVFAQALLKNAFFIHEEPSLSGQ